MALLKPGRWKAIEVRVNNTRYPLSNLTLNWIPTGIFRPARPVGFTTRAAFTSAIRQPAHCQPLVTYSGCDDIRGHPEFQHHHQDPGSGYLAFYMRVPSHS